MAMTAAVKDELSRLTVVKPCCRKAEAASLLRFAGSIHLVQGRIVIEAELDTAAAARRLRKDIAEVYGHTSELGVMAPGGLRRGSRYIVRVAKDAGCKFTLGTNNSNASDLGRSEFGIRMIQECKLQWQDFFVPGAWGPKAIERKGSALKG